MGTGVGSDFWGIKGKTERKKIKNSEKNKPKKKKKKRETDERNKID
jgi:hypothetical protein